MSVSEKLLKWYQNNKRDLPWRDTKDPYKIWVSEIILQQTRVNQGMSYYYRFVDNFPTISHLAKSSVDQVLKIWQGLGYYSRARNMHKAAIEIQTKFHGIFPKTVEEMRKLPGIGEYTSAAIASIAFNTPVAAVDGNVYRVLSRLYGILESNGSSKGVKIITSRANDILDRNNPGNHNQAMMELGAAICLPKNAQCSYCPLSDNCIAYLNNSVYNYPPKKEKINIKERYFYFLIVKKGSKVLIQQRGDSEIWALLYQFPVIETEKKLDEVELFNSGEWHNIFANNTIKIEHISKTIKHQLTHQLIYASFIELETDSSISIPGTFSVEISKLNDYAFPRLIDKYLSDRDIT